LPHGFGDRLGHVHPVAIVIVGGLLSSTLLDFIVTPTVFYRFGKRAALKSIQPRKEIEL
jgi:Cu(I)/Ag(I) efflux system membrane protein CusA/SilA